jgi:hypothetical protein
LNDFFSVGSIGPIVRKKFTVRENYFNYYKTYTLANFISAFNEKFYDESGKPKLDMFYMKMLSPGIMASLLLRLVDLNFCHKVIDSTIVLKNEKRQLLNDMINKSDFAELLSDYLLPIKNPMRYSISSGLKLGCTALLPLLIHSYHLCFFRDISSLDSTLFGCGSLLFHVVWVSLNFVFTNNRVLFVGSAVYASLIVGYVIISTLIQMWQMRQLKSKTIRWNEISELLKKHNDGQIVIQ